MPADFRAPPGLDSPRQSTIDALKARLGELDVGSLIRHRTNGTCSSGRGSSSWGGLWKLDRNRTADLNHVGEECRSSRDLGLTFQQEISCPPFWTPPQEKGFAQDHHHVDDHPHYMMSIESPSTWAGTHHAHDIGFHDPPPHYFDPHHFDAHHGVPTTPPDAHYGMMVPGNMVHHHIGWGPHGYGIYSFEGGPVEAGAASSSPLANLSPAAVEAVPVKRRIRRGKGRQRRKNLDNIEKPVVPNCDSAASTSAPSSDSSAREASPQSEGGQSLASSILGIKEAAPEQEQVEVPRPGPAKRRRMRKQKQLQAEREKQLAPCCEEKIS